MGAAVFVMFGGWYRWVRGMLGFNFVILYLMLDAWWDCEYVRK